MGDCCTYCSRTSIQIHSFLLAQCWLRQLYTISNRHTLLGIQSMFSWHRNCYKLDQFDGPENGESPIEFRVVIATHVEPERWNTYEFITTWIVVIVVRNARWEWSSRGRYSVIWQNWNATLHHIHSRWFDADPKFAVFLSNRRAAWWLDWEQWLRIENKISKKLRCKIAYLNTTSPIKSDGACHCSEMLDFGVGAECVAVFSNPPQLINLTSRSADGAKRPTTWYGGFVFRACIMNPPNDSSGTCGRISMRSTCPWLTAMLNGSTRNGGRDVAGGMPPPWNGNSEWHTDSGAPLGSAILGS